MHAILRFNVTDVTVINFDATFLFKFTLHVSLWGLIHWSECNPATPFNEKKNLVLLTNT